MDKNKVNNHVDELLLEIHDLQNQNKRLKHDNKALKEQLAMHVVSKSFASGVKVQIVDCFKGHKFGIGEIVEIVEYFENDLWLSKGFDNQKWYITEEEANVC